MIGENGGEDVDLQEGAIDLALPVYPQFKFDKDDYDSVKMRLDLYSSMIVATKYDQGRPMETYALDPADVAAALTNIPLVSGLLPRGCLFWGKANGGEWLAIFVEPKVWPVSVERQKETWYVPMPGLVFIGQGGEYTLYAVKEQYWPVADTPLYYAPCPNVYGNTGVCQGNAPFPPASAGTIWRAVEVFFSSGFNMHLVQGKSLAHKDNILEVWRELHEAGAGEYPLDDLVATNLTLARVVRQ
jgi:PRTRC genetic system protein B